MQAFKKLLPQDSYISTRKVAKRWSISETDFINLNIICKNIDNKEDLYKSIKHLYYSGNLQENPFSLSANYTSDLLNPIERYSLEEQAILISIPKALVGDNIIPGTFNIYDTSKEDKVIGRDNGRGLLLDGLGGKIGDIIYSHGIIVITKPSFYNIPSGYKLLLNEEGDYIINEQGKGIITPLTSLVDSNGIPLVDSENSILIEELIEPIDIEDLKIKYESEVSLQTLNVNCIILDSEFNFTQNTTAIESQHPKYKSFLLESNFTPYCTSIGLYNENNDLIAIAKLSKPLPIAETNSTSITLKIDLGIEFKQFKHPLL